MSRPNSSLTQSAAHARFDRREKLALAVLALAQAMLVIDVTAVNVALPLMSRDLGLDAALASWTVAAYTVPFGGLLLFGGRLADVFGARRMLLCGLAVFTIASLASAIAVEPILFLSARAVQGIGAALVSPAALSTLVRRFDGVRRHRALAVWGGTGGAGAAVGVLIGGLLAGGPGWRWIFLMNVPIGAFVAVALPVAVIAMMPGKRQPLGAGSAIFATIGFASLIAAISLAGRIAVPILAILVAIALALLVGFVLLERRATQPLIRLALLRSRPLISGASLLLVSTGVLIGTFFLLSFRLQVGANWTPLGTGLAFLPIAIGVVAGAQLGGHLLGRFGARRVAPIAMLLAAAGLCAPALGSSDITTIVAASVGAIGLGASFVCASTTALSEVDPAESGAASGLLNSFHELGSGIGVATIAAVAAAGFGIGFAALSAAAVVGAAVAITLPSGKPVGGTVHFGH